MATRRTQAVLKRRRRKRKLLIALIVIAAIAVIAAAVILVIKFSGTSSSNSKRYLASTSGDAEVYFYDDYEQRLFKTNAGISRGAEVTITDETYTENGRTYVVCRYGNETYYVNEKYLVTSKDDIVQEKEKWVRTSVTVYENYEGPEIVSFIKKGTHVNLTGYDELEDDGDVHMYEIECDGVTGWVYGKYLVDTQEDAEAVYTDIYEIHKDRAYGSELYGGSATTLDWYPYESETIEDNEFLEDCRGMYLCAKSLTDIDEYIEIAKSSGVNAIVMDIKDGVGVCPFDAFTKYSPTTANNVSYSFDYVQECVQKIKDAGLYLICRIVVFNDELYGADHPEDCIESTSASQLWPSAFSRNVWEYNVSLAVEVIEKLDPNEIQFDYVRFPEESFKMSQDATTDFKNEYNEEKAEAIQNFLFYATDTVHSYDTYISIDVFAEAAYKYVSAYGQYFPAISNIVDATSAMCYTDHFGTSSDTWSEPYETVSTWAAYCAARQTEIETPGAARTWLSGYSVPWWNPTTIIGTDYVETEAQALYDAGLTGGFMLWNGSSKITNYQSIGSAWGYDYQANADPTRASDD